MEFLQLNRLKKKFFCTFILTFILISGSIQSAENKVIFVSISPQKYIIDKITGNETEVHVLLGTNQNPHTFEPTPSQITKLCESDVFFTTGIPFEKNILKKLNTINKKILIKDTSAGLKKLSIDHDFHISHKDEIEPDPHVWLAIPLLVKQVEIITNILIELMPDKSSYFRANSDNLIAELSVLHEAVKARLAPFNGRAFYIYHPSLGYFADEYGLIQRAIEKGGKKPTAKQISKLVLQLKADETKTIFAQPQFDKTYINTIAQTIGCNVETIDPLEYDIQKNLMTIAGKMIKSFLKND